MAKSVEKHHPVPIASYTRAKKLVKRMEKPMLTDVRFVKKSNDYQWDYPGLTDLFWSDRIYVPLSDAIDTHVKKHGHTNFDMRPTIKKALKNEIQFEKQLGTLAEYDPRAVTLCCQLVGLAAPKQNVVKPIPKKDSELLLQLLRTFVPKVQRITISRIADISSSKLWSLYGSPKVRNQYSACQLVLVRVRSAKRAEKMSLHSSFAKSLKTKLQRALCTVRKINLIVISNRYEKNKDSEHYVAVIVDLATAFELAPDATYVLHYTKEKSDKFWSVRSQGKKIKLHFGRTGTEGRTTKTIHASAKAARRQGFVQLHKKLQAGYRMMSPKEAAELFSELKF